MKKIFIAIAILFAVRANAQVQKINLQASGLTCSMCSNSINKALKTLPFVQSVFSNIKTSSFEIAIKPGVPFSFDDIKNKVEDAGFSVASLKATVRFNGVMLSANQHMREGDMTLHFLNAKAQELKGDKVITILDKGYVSPKLFKKNESLTSMSCYKTGVAGDCCTGSGIKSGTRIYHVSI